MNTTKKYKIFIISLLLLFSCIAMQTVCMAEEYVTEDLVWTGGYDDEGLGKNTDYSAKTVEIYSAEQLASFAKLFNSGISYSGYTVTLESDIDLANIPWTPISGSSEITFDGQDHTIKNLKVTRIDHAGLFGYGVGIDIKNVKIDGATITSNHYAGAILAQGYIDVINCEVRNAIVTCIPEWTGTEWDNGDKVGAVIGQICEGGNRVIGNVAINCKVTGYRDVGGIVGYTNEDVIVESNSVKNITLVNNRKYNYKNYTSAEDYDVNDVVGENASPENYSDNTSFEVTKEVIEEIE